MKIFGLDISVLKYSDFFEKITKSKKKIKIFTPNPEILLEANKDKEFLEILQKGDFLIPDGIGLYLAFQIFDNTHGKIVSLALLPIYIFKLFFGRKKLYKKYGERICGSNLTFDLLDYADKNKIGVSIIDRYSSDYPKKQEIQKKLISLLNKKYKNIIFHLYIYRQNNLDNIVKEINKTNDKILLSTLGAKKQEKLIIDIEDKIKNINLFLGVGSSIDYLVGLQKKAPNFFKILGLEWFYRLIVDKRKIQRVKRVYKATFGFLIQVLKTKKN